MHKSDYRIIFYYITFVFIATANSACGVNQTITPKSSLTETDHLVQNTFIPTTTSIPNTTQTLISTPTKTMYPSDTPTFTQEPMIEVQQIVKVNYDPNNSNLGIWTACWSDVGETLYYAISIDSPYEENLKWISHDLLSGKSIELDSPPECYRGYTKISPSGRYYLEEKVDIPAPTDLPRVFGLYDIWLVDTVEQTKNQLIESIVGGLGLVQWSNDEKTALFSLAWVGDSPVYVLKVQDGIAIPLSEIFAEYGANVFILSPDGSKVVVYSVPEAFIQIISLEDGHITIIPEIGVRINWSLDSQLLYYWSGPDFGNAEQVIRVYSMKTEESCDVINRTTLESLNLCPTVCDFAVSVSGDKVALWWSNLLWTVTLP